MAVPRIVVQPTPHAITGVRQAMMTAGSTSAPAPAAWVGGEYEVSWLVDGLEPEFTGLEPVLPGNFGEYPGGFEVDWGGETGIVTVPQFEIPLANSEGRAHLVVARTDTGLKWFYNGVEMPLTAPPFDPEHRVLPRIFAGRWIGPVRCAAPACFPALVVTPFRRELPIDVSGA